MAEVDQNKMLQSDPDLIQACRAGDARAWERLLDKYEIEVKDRGPED